MNRKWSNVFGDHNSTLLINVQDPISKAVILTTGFDNLNFPKEKVREFQFVITQMLKSAENYNYRSCTGVIYLSRKQKRKKSSSAWVLMYHPDLHTNGENSSLKF